MPELLNQKTASIFPPQTVSKKTEDFFLLGTGHRKAKTNTCSSPRYEAKTLILHRSCNSPDSSCASARAIQVSFQHFHAIHQVLRHSIVYIWYVGAFNKMRPLAHLYTFTNLFAVLKWLNQTWSKYKNDSIVTSMNCMLAVRCRRWVTRWVQREHMKSAMSVHILQHCDNPQGFVSDCRFWSNSTSNLGSCKQAVSLPLPLNRTILRLFRAGTQMCLHFCRVVNLQCPNSTNRAWFLHKAKVAPLRRHSKREQPNHKREHKRPRCKLES